MYSPPFPPSLLHKEGGNALCLSYIPPLYGVERGIKGVSSWESGRKDKTDLQVMKITFSLKNNPCF
ncbi:MAG: hypothetical protein A2X03_06445 [Bacteroidetes bacterium GWA2_40_15]|nr:MAG: hypothetical protein A2X03_06445 [Bacteroidetes bacterium GWA2_40_15]